jgi:hypothetical protein
MRNVSTRSVSFFIENETYVRYPGKPDRELTLHAKSKSVSRDWEFPPQTGSNPNVPRPFRLHPEGPDHQKVELKHTGIVKTGTEHAATARSRRYINSSRSNRSQWRTCRQGQECRTCGLLDRAWIVYLGFDGFSATKGCAS